eukprot:c12411_g1_i4.p1 GENE.c12411_g1_i4~~c12411_g1_i4.p1  ORF type:complete len:128 (-),score=20.32 c12411_g1_i4:253-636(-)
MPTELAPLAFPTPNHSLESTANHSLASTSSCDGTTLLTTSSSTPPHVMGSSTATDSATTWSMSGRSASRGSHPLRLLAKLLVTRPKSMKSQERSTILRMYANRNDRLARKGHHTTSRASATPPPPSP